MLRRTALSWRGQSKKSVLFAIQLLGIYFFLMFLVGTDALYNVYLFCGFAAAFFLIDNTLFGIPFITKKKSISYRLVSVLFAFCIILSNYPLWYFNGEMQFLLSAIKVFFVFFGSITIAWNTILWLDKFFSESRIAVPVVYRHSLKQASLLFFFAFTGVNLAVLFLCNYPGNLTPDSISQMTQLLSDQYSNHHPFWHTIVIKCCVMLGMWLFGEINAAVACYSVFQIVFMASCFTFCIVTLYQVEARKGWIIVSTLFFIVTPYHMSYSITMWKDVPFGGAVLVFISALFRFLYDIGNRKWVNWFALVLGSLGMCLWRSNGWIAFALTLVFFAAFFFAKYKKTSIILLLVLVGTYVLIHPVLAMWDITQPDAIESLSIPAQQIARVVTDGGKLSVSDRELLQKVVNVEEIPETYKSYISDPIKHLVRRTGDQEYLQGHKGEYLKLWLSIGVKNPLKYLEAWIDQTKGYWNAGYQYWIYSDAIFENQLGIEKKEVVPLLPTVEFVYLWLFDHCDLFAIFRSIGLCTWLIVICSVINFANNRKKAAFLGIPLLSIIATLCIATPVFCEFRYAYALFTCLPLIVCTTNYERKEEMRNG